MSRDHRKLLVFTLADGLVSHIYTSTASFPAHERYGLQAQLRRAAISVVTNIVEGSARRSTGEYLNFLNIAAGSTAEAWYLVELSNRLGYLGDEDAAYIAKRYRELASRLGALMAALSNRP